MNVPERFEREARLIGEEGVRLLASSSAIVFGAGGVGGAAIEALARAGLGEIAVVDPDVVSESNLNRQLLATEETIGKSKCEAAAARVRLINPACRVKEFRHFYRPEYTGFIRLEDYDFIIDAIDTVSSKLFLISEAKKAGIPMISSMGTGNKLDPSRLRATDISKTNTCPLAAVIRRECRKRNLGKLRAIWSDETPIKAVAEARNGRHSPGSISFVPPVAGMIAAGEAVTTILKMGRRQNEKSEITPNE